MMLQWLIWMLTPIFTKMGVSEVDVQTYVNSLSGYIYAIFGSLLLAVAVMVAVHFFAKGHAACRPLDGRPLLGPSGGRSG